MSSISFLGNMVPFASGVLSCLSSLSNDSEESIWWEWIGDGVEQGEEYDLHCIMLVFGLGMVRDTVVSLGDVGAVTYSSDADEDILLEELCRPKALGVEHL